MIMVGGAGGEGEAGDSGVVLSPHGDPACVTGELAIAVPSLGTSQSLLNRDHTKTYFDGMPRLGGGRCVSARGGGLAEGRRGCALKRRAPPRCLMHRWFLRRHGDEVERLPGGYYRAHGRVDDTMNLGGIKTSSVELERVCVEGVAGVVEAAAVACPTPGTRARARGAEHARQRSYVHVLARGLTPN